MVDYFIDNQVFYHHGKFSHIVKVVLSETFLIGIAILKRLTIFVLVQTMLFYEKIITWFNSFIFILLGCEGVNDSVDHPHNPEEICDSHYVIPVAEAIDNLKTFLESIGEPTTRCSGLDFDNVISIPHR